MSTTHSANITTQRINELLMCVYNTKQPARWPKIHFWLDTKAYNQVFPVCCITNGDLCAMLHVVNIAFNVASGK